MLDRLFKFTLRSEGPAGLLQVGSQTVPVRLVRHPRARRYIMRLRADGTAHVTVPRAGTIAAALAFAARNTAWLERELQRLAAKPKIPAVWRIGTDIYFRGELVRLDLAASGAVQVGNELVTVPDT